MDPLWFFPERGQRVDLARAICEMCPAETRSKCLEYALRIGPLLHGIWGGTSERQRRILRQERQLATGVLDLRVIEGEREGMTDPVLAPSSSGNASDGDGAVRSCSECGGPLAENRQYTCGPDCARARKVRVKRAAPDPRRNHRTREAGIDQTPTGGVPVSAGVSPSQDWL